METTDTLALVSRQVRALVRRLARNPGHALIVPAVPENPPAPAGHFHTLPEIFVQMSGSTDFVLPWQRFRLRAGQTCIVPPYTPHTEYFSHGKARFHYLVGMLGYDGMSWHQGVFSEADRFHSTHLVYCQLHDMHRLLGLLTEAVACGSRPRPFGPIQTRGAALLAFSALLEAIEAAGRNPPIEHPKIAFCKQYIRNHLNDTGLCVKTLARHVECSPNYLSSLFRRQTGDRITDFLNARRLERVKDLLLHSTLNISEIAQACGYADPAYMTRLFVRAFHVAPRLYRVRAAPNKS